MNDQEFDQLVRTALAQRAEDEVARHAPAKLALRRLAVKLGAADEPRVSVRLNTGINRKSSPMRRLALNASAAVIVVLAVVLAVGFFGSRDGQYGAGAPVFESVRHGYSQRLPDDTWSVNEYPGEWEFGSFLDADVPGIDYFESSATPPQGTLVYVWGSSQPIPAGMSFDGWLYAQDGVTAQAQPCFELQGSYETVRVDGERGRLGAYRCASFQDSGVPWSVIQVLSEHAGRGYAMYFWPEQEPAAPPLPDIRQDALRWLSYFRFTDDATSSPNP